MALIYCTKCGHQVSTAAPGCPECGAPPYSRATPPDEASTTPLPSARPSTPGVASIVPARSGPAGRAAEACPNCGRHWGEGRSCQFCKQVEGLPIGVTIASPMRRLAAFLADLALVLCLDVAVYLSNYLLGVAVKQTLGGIDSSLSSSGSIAGPDYSTAIDIFVWAVILISIGYFVWMLYLFSRGQSPGKFLTGIRIVKLDAARAAGFGTCLLREVVAKPVILLLSIVTLGVVNFWLLWDKDTQELWDKVAGTIVVNDSSGLTIRSR
ncbi:MAG: RDD family protein [Candidatus Binataceae bacterium]